jgi:hypothetical protein
MRSLRSILSGRVLAISRRVVVVQSRPRRGHKPVGSGGAKGARRATPPGFFALSEKLARASEKVRRARHGRRTA